MQTKIFFGNLTEIAARNYYVNVEELVKIFVAIENQWFKDFCRNRKIRWKNNKQNQNTLGDMKNLAYVASSRFRVHSRMFFMKKSHLLEKNIAIIITFISSGQSQG